MFASLPVLHPIEIQAFLSITIKDLFLWIPNPFRKYEWNVNLKRLDEDEFAVCGLTLLRRHEKCSKMIGWWLTGVQPKVNHVINAMPLRATPRFPPLSGVWHVNGNDPIPSPFTSPLSPPPSAPHPNRLLLIGLLLSLLITDLLRVHYKNCDIPLHPFAFLQRAKKN